MEVDAAGRAAPGRVLIVLLGAIGDVVRALPLLGRIRRAWPNAYIAWAAEPKSAPILRSNRWLDELLIYDRRQAPWSFVPFLRKVRAGRFDLAIDLQRHLKSGVIALTSGASDRLGFAAPNTKEFNHLFSTRQIEPQPNLRLKLAQYQIFADTLGLPPAPIEFGLELTPEEDAHAKKLLASLPRPMLGVILGSSWPSRLYFPEAVAEVIRSLAFPVEGSPALYPVLIGGPEETAQAEAVMSELGEISALNLTGQTTLRELIRIFSECAVAFGPDSGPMHIAAAVGCPVVSLWGSTSPDRSAPWGFADLVIRAEIPCHPCYLRECPIGRECMRRISPSAVASAIRRAMRSYPRSFSEKSLVQPESLSAGKAE
ncbi:MAG TPA: glycosyltransferase family 9 protein [Candidatus Binataceae bacterium]|nr:glycosyltransferase family 9 protein [Candidatus Binataceae bacterium]